MQKITLSGLLLLTLSAQTIDPSALRNEESKTIQHAYKTKLLEEKKAHIKHQKPTKAIVNQKAGAMRQNNSSPESMMQQRKGQ